LRPLALAPQLKRDPLGGTVDLDDIAQRISVVSSDEVVQRLPKLLLDWTQDNRTALYILLALAVGFVVGRYRASRASAYQNRSEALLSHVVQTNFGFPDYHLMNHVTLQLKDGTTQVDHILVSRFGVFVIETKDYKGWNTSRASSVGTAVRSNPAPRSLQRWARDESTALPEREP